MFSDDRQFSGQDFADLRDDVGATRFHGSGSALRGKDFGLQGISRGSGHSS